MDDNKRYNVHGFSALSGLLEHVNVIAESAGAAVPPITHPATPAPSSELQTLLVDIQSKLGRVVELLGGQALPSTARQMEHKPSEKRDRSIFEPSGGAPVDGVYDGEGNMVADDGTRHRIPPGYIAKAYLQEGDLMQFTMGEGGMKKFKKMRNY